MKYSRPSAHTERDLAKTRARLAGGTIRNIVPPTPLPAPPVPGVKPSLTDEQKAVADANRAMRAAQKAEAEKLTPQEEARVSAAIELAKAATDPAPTSDAASVEAPEPSISTEGSADATAEPEAGPAFEGVLDDGEDEAPEDSGKPEAQATDELLN